MNCRDFEENVTAFAEGSLETALQRNMEEHCASCPNCAKLAEVHQVIFASLNNTEPVKAPRGLADRILSAVKQEAPDNVVEFKPAETGAVSADSYGFAPLDCRVFEDNVAAYVDGFLKGKLLGAMDRHSASCPSCERLTNAHTIILASLNTAEPLKAPEGLAERILAAVEAEAVETEKSFSLVKLLKNYDILPAAAAWSLAAASVIIIGGFIKQLSTTIYMPDSLSALFSNISALPLLLQAWIAAIIPTDYWHQINLLLDPVEIPYLSLSLPPFYFGMLIFFAASVWIYFSLPITPGMATASYDDMVV